MPQTSSSLWGISENPKAVGFGTEDPINLFDAPFIIGGRRTGGSGRMTTQGLPDAVDGTKEDR